MISVRRPSPALVISCVALALALGGTSFAAVSALPKNSVGTPQLEGLRGHVREGQEPLLAASRLRIRPAACRACRSRGTCRARRASRPGGSECGRARRDYDSDQLGEPEDGADGVPGRKTAPRRGRETQRPECFATGERRDPGVVPRQRQHLPSDWARSGRDRRHVVAHRVRRLRHDRLKQRA